jgi:uncharacterized membrane protein YqjE
LTLGGSGRRSVFSLVRQLLGSAAGIVATRLELWTLELERELASLARLWLHATVTLFLLFTGTLLAVGWLLMWADPAHRLTIIGALALGFLGSAAVAAWRWRIVVRMRRPLMAAAVADLRRAGRGLGAPGAAAPVRPAPPGPWSP